MFCRHILNYDSSSLTFLLCTVLTLTVAHFFWLWAKMSRLKHSQLYWSNALFYFLNHSWRRHCQSWCPHLQLPHAMPGHGLNDFPYILLLNSFFINDFSRKSTVCLPLPSARQHPSYGDCLEVKREYCQNSSVLDCVTQCSQSAAHLYEQFLQVQEIGFVTLGPLRCV